MSQGTQDLTLNIQPPSGGGTLNTETLTETDFTGCSGTVSVTSSLITTGPGIGKHLAQRGALDISFFNRTYKVEVNASGAGSQGPWRFGLRGIADCGTAGGTGTRFFVSIEGNGGVTCAVQVNGQTTLFVTEPAGTIETRSRWTIVHNDAAGTVAFSYENWNGASWDAPVAVFTANRSASGQTWPQIYFDALNAYVGQEDLETGVPGTVTYQINNF